MNAKEYKKIRDEIYRKYPTGIDHMALSDTDTLFEKLSGKITISEHFSSEHVIHLLNIQATKKHLAKYIIKLQMLYDIAEKFTKKPRSSANKAYKNKLNLRIDNISKLINESKANIKMSMYGINDQLIQDTQTIKKNISS